MSFVDHTLYEALPYGFMVLGLVLSYRYLQIIDLTFAASFSLGTAVLARLLVIGVDWWLAVAAALGSAVVVTTLTVLLIFLLQVESLLAGLISSFAGYAAALMFTRGSLAIPSASNPVAALKALDRPFLWDSTPLHPTQLLAFTVLLLAALAGVHLFLRSEAGLAFRAIEDRRSSEHVLAAIGLSVSRVSAIGLYAANALAVLTGILVVLKEGQATAQRGFDAVLTAITAYLLGVTLFEARPREVIGAGRGGARIVRKIQLFSPPTAALIGVVLYFLVLKAVSYLPVPSSAPKLVLVGLLVGAIGVSRWPSIRSRLDMARQDRTSPVNVSQSLVASSVFVAYPGYPEPVSVLEAAHLVVAPGELLHLRGENGSGKSTFLRFLAGEIPGRGYVQLPQPTCGTTTSRRFSVALVRQDASLGSPAVLTVREHLALVATGGVVSPLRGASAREIPEEARRATDSFRAELVGHLSGGQRQVLNIASLLARPQPPRVVLFDEPLTHLDESNALRCVELMDTLKQRGHCLVVVQHDIPTEPALHQGGSQPSRAVLARLISRTVDLRHLTPDTSVSSGGDTPASAPASAPV